MIDIIISAIFMKLKERGLTAVQTPDAGIWFDNERADMVGLYGYVMADDDLAYGYSVAVDASRVPLGFFAAAGNSGTCLKGCELLRRTISGELKPRYGTMDEVSDAIDRYPEGGVS